MEELQRFGISMPTQLLNEFDTFIRKQGYTNRSQAVRDLIRREIVDQTWEQSTGQVTGILTLVYDHHSNLPGAITGVQHTHHELIVCTVHVHLDEHRCMEVIVLRGTACNVKEIADNLISLKGVEYGRLTATAIAGP